MNGRLTRTWPLLCMLHLFSLPGWAAAADAYVRPVVTCPRRSTPLEIDGRVAGAEWDGASHIADYLLVSGDGPAGERTDAYLCHDATNLYLAFVCHDTQMQAVKARITARDDNVYNDDCVEVFLDPGLSRKHFYQFLVNSLGTLQDFLHEETSTVAWNADALVVATRGPDSWMVELAIPLADIGIEDPESGLRVGANFTRTVNRLSEYSCWAPTGSDSFHVPGKFGDMIFTSGAGIDFRILGWASDLSSVNAMVSRDAPSELSLKVVAVSEDGTERQTARVVAPESFSQPLALDCVFPASWSDYTAHIEVTEVVSGTLLYRSAPMRLAGSMGAKLAKARLEIDRMKAEMLLLKAGASDTGYLVTPAAPFESMAPTTVPNGAMVNQSIRVVAAPGEYEPAGCLVYTVNDLDGIRIKLSGDLQSTAGAIPESAVDIRVVKWWVQGGRSHKYGKPVLVQELLLKDDGLVTARTATMRNVMHFIGRPADGPALKPFNIPACSSKKVWLTVHVPDGAPPGLYKGAVCVVPANAPETRIPIEVDVLPFRLVQTRRLFSMYYYSPMSDSGEVDWDMLKRELADMRAHGLTSVAVGHHDLRFREGPGGDWSMDLDRLRRELEFRVNAGMTGPVPLGVQTHKEPFPRRLFRGPWQADNQPDPEDVEKLATIVRAVDGLVREHGLPPVYIQGIDEPNFDYTGKALDRCAVLFEVIKNSGGKTFTALDVVAAGKLGRLIDMAIYNSKSVFPLMENPAVHDPDTLQLHYWHPLENPVYDRVHFGVMVWKAGLDGACPYAYRHSYKGGAYYDESEGKPKTVSSVNRNIMYTYPGRSGPIPTIQWEAVREGIDDVRYMETLSAWLDKARAHPSSPGLDRAIQDASEMLMLSRFEAGDYITFLESVTPADFDALRSDLIRCILEIRKQLGVDRS